MLVMECYLTTTYHNLKRWLIVMLVPYMLKTLYFLNCWPFLCVLFNTSVLVLRADQAL